jgi:hypothetical protein
MKLMLNTEGKPNLEKFIRANKEKAKHFLDAWMKTADELVQLDFPVDLLLDTSEQLNIKPSELLAGIIAGCLNEQFVNEKLAPILGKDLLPVGILTLKGMTLEGEETYADWRRWYHLERSTEIDADTIAKVIGGIMKYARFLDFDKLSEALEANQLVIFKSLGNEQAKLLPFYPALQYQKNYMVSDFKVGKFMPERNAGFFDCGTIDPAEKNCPACGRRDLMKSKDEVHIYCRACNAGYYPMREVND